MSFHYCFLCFFLLVYSLPIHALEQVSLQLNWKHQFEYAGFYAAKAKGFYREVGLELKIKEYEHGIDVSNEVLLGKSTYGISSSQLILERLSGKKVVLLASYLKQNALVLVSQPEIMGVNDLKNKKIMVTEGELENTSLAALLGQFNISLNELDQVEHSFDVQDFIEGKVDAMSAFLSNELYELERQQVKYNVFNPAEFGIYSFDVELFTSQNTAFLYREKHKKFIQATKKGWEYAFKHKDEIIELIFNQYSKRKSPQALLFEANKIEKLFRQEVYQIGAISKELIELNTLLYQNIGLANKPFDLTGYVFNPDESDQLNISLNLSLRERKYLAQKKSLSVCVDPDWMPLEKIEKGKHIGIAADYLALLSKQLKLPISLVNANTWDDMVGLAKNRQCDFFSLVTNTAAFAGYMDFSLAYLDLPLVLATTHDKAYVDDVANIGKQTVAIVKGYAFRDLVLEKFPRLNVVEVNSIMQGLEMVEKGKVYAYVDNLMSTSYYIQRFFTGNLKVSGRLELDLSLGIATRSDQPVLNTIMKKSMLNIAEDKKQAIINRWVSIKFDNTLRNSLINKFIAITIIFLLLYLFREAYLRHYNKKLSLEVERKIKELEEKNNMILHQHKLASMGEMIANIAHQWRQPLAGLNGVILNLDYDYQHNQLDDLKMEKYLNEAESITTYMSNTIEAFSNFFAPDKAKEEFDIRDVLFKAKVIIGPSLNYKNISLQMNVQEGLRINSYPSELLQVVLTLVNNAIDALMKSNVKNKKITIVYYGTIDQKCIIVKDNAGGIAEDIINEIYYPYFTTKHKSKGTGLGLYIAKTVIEKNMGGKLDVHNDGEGAVFTIEI